MGSKFGAKAKKAWAGGVAGAAVAAGTYVWSGAGIAEEAGRFVGLVAGGFVLGFLGVYFAPKNTAS